MGRLFRSIRAKVVLVYILLLILVLQFAGAYSVRAIEQFYLENFRTTVRAQTDLLAAHVEPYLAAYAEKGVPADLGGNLPTLVSRFVSVIGSEVQVIDRNGTILAASFDTGNVVGKEKRVSRSVPCPSGHADGDGAERSPARVIACRWWRCPSNGGMPCWGPCG
jgi:hypothetical protein